jgi:hypothetical protein
LTQPYLFLPPEQPQRKTQRTTGTSRVNALPYHTQRI